MLEVSEKEVINRFRLDNPWWNAAHSIDEELQNMPKRAYLSAFESLVQDLEVRRAVILMGPKRVGKTVMCFQTIQTLIRGGVEPNGILYLSLDTPIYSGVALEALLNLFLQLHERQNKNTLYVFYDEIQYLKHWGIHLKSLVDTYRNIRFVASGSAAAALKLKSQESGAGRFTEFMLPPLTFSEYLKFIGKEDVLIPGRKENGKFMTSDIHSLNEHFIDYINIGGYPEAVFSERIRSNPARYIRNDIIDKVLLRDLPSLYGINDIQELNRLFATLAYNSGQEVSYEALSRSSGVAKNTIKKYIEYLEAAFLIVTVKRVDNNSKRFKRAVTLKVYLTNPSMRAALFEPVSDGQEVMGSIVETAIFSQWMHNSDATKTIHYARWKSGEVDIVYLKPSEQKPDWVVEIKWSDRYIEHLNGLSSLIEFCKNNGLPVASVTSKSTYGTIDHEGIKIEFTPSSLYCYTVGKNTTGYETERRLSR